MSRIIAKPDIITHQSLVRINILRRILRVMGKGHTTTRPLIAEAVADDEDESFVRRRPTRPGRRITFPPFSLVPVVVPVEEALEAVGVDGEAGVVVVVEVVESEEPAAGRQIIT